MKTFTTKLGIAAIASALVAIAIMAASDSAHAEPNKYTFFVPYTSYDDSGIAKVIGADCYDAVKNAREMIDDSYVVIDECIGSTDAELTMLDSSTDWL